MKLNIKMIVFDVFGVVITEGHMVSNALMPLLPKDTDKAVVKAWYHSYTQGEISEQAFWQGIGQPNNSHLRDTFLNTFTVDESLPHVIRELSAKYQLAILSNLGSEWAATLSQKFDFAQHFNPIIFSGDVGCQKPQPRIYEILVEQSQLKAEAIIFIDDRLENLKVAADLGMKTIHLQVEDDTYDFEANYTIHKLSDLTKLSL